MLKKLCKLKNLEREWMLITLQQQPPACSSVSLPPEACVTGTHSWEPKKASWSCEGRKLQLRGVEPGSRFTRRSHCFGFTGGDRSSAAADCRQASQLGSWEGMPAPGPRRGPQLYLRGGDWKSGSWEGNWDSVCRPGKPESHRDQASSAFWLKLGLKVCAITFGWKFGLYS